MDRIPAAAVVRKWQRQHLMELYRYNGILNKGEVRSLIYQYTESNISQAIFLFAVSHSIKTCLKLMLQSC